jgi:hypothetical protein
MNFSDRVRARWRASIIMFCIGLAVTEGFVWLLMNFVVFAALHAASVTVPDELQRMILILNQITVFIAACAMWLARGIQMSRDAYCTVENASPMEKKIIGVQLVEEAGMSNEKIDRLIAAEHVEVVDLTGTSP